MGKIQTVIFDLDGTLIDSLGDIHQAVNVMLASFEKPLLDAGTVRGFVGHGAARLIERVRAITVDAPAQDVALAAFRAAYQADPVGHTKVYGGVIEALEKLKSDKVKCGICTNKPGDEARQVVTGLGLERYFDVLIGGGDVARLKPDPLPLHAAMHALQVAPENTLYIGDSMVDVQTAIAAKTAFLLYEPAGGGFGSEGIDSAILDHHGFARFDNYHDLRTV